MIVSPGLLAPFHRPPGSGPLPGGTVGTVSVGGLGDPGTVLLSGPRRDGGRETLAGHVGRWGTLPELDGGQVLALLRSSGLDGRGGGGFPLARKVATALAGGGRPVLVVNASESEPASGKDRLLCARRPHLVLDGAALVATALGVSSVTVHLHRGADGPVEGVTRAVAERRSCRLDGVEWRVSRGPDRYVSGEASAVAGFLHDGDARPRFAVTPLALTGPSGRPTVVVNAETVAHLAVVARIGAGGWASLGPPSFPGSRLVTHVGAVDHPGRVLEVVGAATVGELLAPGGVTGPPAAVLVGGFAGTWLEGRDAWSTPFDRTALVCLGASPGCGLLGVLPHGACGLVEAARIVRYLAGESAGQCGTCVAGLPRLAAGLSALAQGTFRRRGLARLAALGDELLGSGACGHPDGVVRLVRSTLEVFADDVVRHLAGAPCRGADHPAVLGVPDPYPTDGGPRSEEDFA